MGVFVVITATRKTLNSKTVAYPGMKNISNFGGGYKDRRPKH